MEEGKTILVDDDAEEEEGVDAEEADEGRRLQASPDCKIDSRKMRPRKAPDLIDPRCFG